MTTFSEALNAALLHFVWQGIVVAFLLWTALALLRKSTANARYAVGCCAMALTIALPVATAWMLYRGPTAFSGGVAFPNALDASGGSRPAWVALSVAAAKEWAVPFWAAGVMLFALRLALSFRHVVTLRGTGFPAENWLVESAMALAMRMRVTRPVRVLISKIAESPSVVSWLRPIILLPAATVTGLSPEQLQAVLAHEMAHIRRHDYPVNVVQSVIETLLFYHPAVWWVSARVRHERELCCDDLAVGYCGDAAVYARALTTLERLRTMPGPALAANGGPLMYRVRRLIGRVPESGPPRVPVFLALVAAALCIQFSVRPAHGQRPAPKDGNAQTESALVTEQFLKENLDAINKKLADLKPDAAAVERLRQQVAALELKISRVRLEENRLEELAVLEPVDGSKLRALQEELARLTRRYTPRHPRVLEVKDDIEAAQTRIAAQLAGRKLVSIDRGNLPRGFQLPVHVGDVLTSGSVNGVISAVGDLDPNLEVQFLIGGHGAAALRIEPR